jgi:hypothetical protein
MIMSLQLTAWSKVLLEMLIVARLVNKTFALLWNPKMHYHAHNRPPHDRILRQASGLHPS